MTRIFIKFMALFAAIIMIVGCEKDNDRFEKEGGLQTLTVAALSGNPNTKVNITPNEGDALGFKVEWKVGDKLHASSADGETYIATFEIKNADDIAADGSARFTAVEGTTTLLELGTSYKFHHNYYEENYNEGTSLGSYDNMYDEAINKNYLMHSILHTESATTINNGITLSHLLSYIELTVDVADISTAMVRFKYTDKKTGKEFVHRYQFYNWEGVADGTKYTFNFPIYPAVLTAEKPVTVELSNDSGSSYTEQFRIASDDEFRAGMHYRIKNNAAITPVGFPSSAVPVIMVKDGSTTMMREISTIEINEKNKTTLGNIQFCIGYNKRRVNGTNYLYSIFKDATWSSSEGRYPINRNPYLSITPNDNGSIKLTLLRALPVERTITITATAPNEAEMSFEVMLKGNAVVAPTSVELDRDLFVANIGAEMTLSATVSPTNATNKGITWTSSDETVATVDVNGNVTTKDGGETIITATTKEGSKTAKCTVIVNENREYDMYKVGDYYPNEDYPVGVVFMVNNDTSIDSYGTIGKVISLDEFTGKFSTADNIAANSEDRNGYENMVNFYNKYENFSSSPAYQWVAEKNKADYTYPSGAKDQWYIAGDTELRQLISGMCGYIMGGTSTNGIKDWGRYNYMKIDGSTYTPNLTDFNKKITDKGGKPISTSNILSSSLSGSDVYVLKPSDGRVVAATKNSETKVRAILSFDTNN